MNRTRRLVIVGGTALAFSVGGIGFAAAPRIDAPEPVVMEAQESEPDTTTETPEVTDTPATPTREAQTPVQAPAQVRTPPTQETPVQAEPEPKPEPRPEPEVQETEPEPETVEKETEPEVAEAKPVEEPTPNYICGESSLFYQSDMPFPESHPPVLGEDGEWVCIHDHPIPEPPPEEAEAPVEGDGPRANETVEG